MAMDLNVQMRNAKSLLRFNWFRLQLKMSRKHMNNICSTKHALLSHQFQVYSVTRKLITHCVTSFSLQTSSKVKSFTYRIDILKLAQSQTLSFAKRLLLHGTQHIQIMSHGVILTCIRFSESVAAIL